MRYWKHCSPFQKEASGFGFFNIKNCLPCNNAMQQTNHICSPFLATSSIFFSWKWWWRLIVLQTRIYTNLSYSKEHAGWCSLHCIWFFLYAIKCTFFKQKVKLSQEKIMLSSVCGALVSTRSFMHAEAPSFWSVLGSLFQLHWEMPLHIWSSPQFIVNKVKAPACVSVYLSTCAWIKTVGGGVCSRIFLQPSLQCFLLSHNNTINKTRRKVQNQQQKTLALAFLSRKILRWFWMRRGGGGCLPCCDACQVLWRNRYILFRW